MPGQLILEPHPLSGLRDYLDGREVHAGDTLQLYLNGEWRDVRYDVNAQSGDAWLHVGERAVLVVYRPVLTLRWPPADGEG